ncbi:hypothetical protein H8K35_03160 [Undibacterium sp. LX40W]|uniref:Uncharacterized protein n=1 Tax=Undibacterium nitidum TaxID=2762298 RepID=A0A923HT07_9BURK|nr:MULTISPECIES: hypothetical protein [Undibacterium]MBC3880614.1 hypothetical protein [Undibacterium nitidum]MBC3890650.1 hypothetical protein [Undibacterium sp. LX40W]
MTYIKLSAFALALFFSSSASASIEDARKDILNTYNFDPSMMTYEEQANRAPTLSQLWSRFNKSPEGYRDALRILLKEKGQQEILYCDGGMLFLANATSPADQNLGMDSIKKCTLTEIQQTPYFYTMHQQAIRGVDTIELQFKMLTRPEYQITVPAHALNLAQDYCFVYPLLVQDETKYTLRLIEKIKLEKDPVALKTLLLALYYAALPNSEAAIHFISQSKEYPVDIQELARQIEMGIAKARQAAPSKVFNWLKENGSKISPNALEKELRDARRERMRTISDEALMELGAYTLLIYHSQR